MPATGCRAAGRSLTRSRSADYMGCPPCGWLLLYDSSDPDTQAQSIVFDGDEADQMYSRPITDRLAAIERRLRLTDHDA